MAGKQRQNDALILALAAGKPHAQAARECGLSVRTVQRRIADENFKRAVHEARSGMFAEAVGLLAAASAEAAGALRKLLTAESETVRLSAARSILELGTKLREASELAERIERLEARINEQHRTPTDRTGTQSRNGRAARL